MLPENSLTYLLENFLLSRLHCPTCQRWRAECIPTTGRIEASGRFQKPLKSMPPSPVFPQEFRANLLMEIGEDCAGTYRRLVKNSTVFSSYSLPLCAADCWGEEALGPNDLGGFSITYSLVLNVLTPLGRSHALVLYMGSYDIFISR
jgi:hypothetical protein